MQVLSFIKKLQIFDVIWGRRAKVLHGIKDGGAKAAEIADTNIAKAHNGNTIFNVNHPDNECLGGHYHDGSDLAFFLTQNCYFSRSGTVYSNTWLLADSKPSNVSGHNISVSAPLLKKIGINNASLNTFDVGIYQHDGITYSLLTTVSLVNQRSLDVSVNIALTQGLDLAMMVVGGSGQEIDANLIITGT